MILKTRAYSHIPVHIHALSFCYVKSIPAKVVMHTLRRCTLIHTHAHTHARMRVLAAPEVNVR
jgi:hypothetical protein